MKKLAIAGASVALAAMPVVGVFADNVVTSNNTVVDTVQLTISKTCQMEVDSSKATASGEAPNTTYGAPYGGSYSLGTSTVAHIFDGSNVGDGAGSTHSDGGIQGTPMTLTCNGNGASTGDNPGIGWSLSATTTSLSRDLGTGVTDAYAIPFGSFVSTGTSSVWSAKLNLTAASGSSMTAETIATNTAVTSGWDNWSSTTSGTTVILKGVAGKSVDGLVVTPAYKAYGAAKQPAGVYSGTITYTFADLSQ